MLSPVARPWARFHTDEDGSTLMMYPFGILIVFLLGAIAIDAAVLFQARRQAVDVSAGLASDIAAMIDEESFATTGVARVDAARAAAAVDFANTRTLAEDPNRIRCTEAIDLDEVSVTCSGTGQALLLPLTGASGAMSFTVSSTASLTERG